MALPSFSIIIETENLSSAELAGLSRCLDALATQDLSPTIANEVLIVESGDVPVDVIERLRQDYPWLTFRRTEPGVDYYTAKMQGVSFTHGEVIVFCDSDCTYETSWLRNLLTPFAENQEIQVVAGETTTPILGSYGLAIAMTYIFPRFSRLQALQPSSSYFCNNVAFRRNFLVKHPIPSQLPIYRGNCVVHARSLQDQGYIIWKQPRSQATHAAPNGLSHFFWRFLLLGYDALAVCRLSYDTQISRLLQDLRACLRLSWNKATEFIGRFFSVFTEDWRYVIYLPIALPIALAALLLYFTGLVLGLLKPNAFLSADNTVQVSWES
jgi:glycosyltransferase involved in cell wall biosynthesis